MTETPLVSVIIPTRNRAAELEKTLGILKLQTYRPIELIIVDDASNPPLEKLAKRMWPEVLFLRKETNVGQCQCRNDAFERANGKYLLCLDDDSCFTQPSDLDYAVTLLEGSPKVGALTFYTFHGPNLPTTRLKSSCVVHFAHRFLAGASIIRKAVIEHSGAYMTLFGNEGEEEELSMRILDCDWAILFVPDVVIHHRVSPFNRHSVRTWERGLRNKLWLIVMHMPLRRALVELSWKLIVGCWDAFRLLRFLSYFRSVGQFLFGLRAVLRIRRPVSALTIKRYDALRLRRVTTSSEYLDPPTCGVREFVHWFWRSWRHRPRVRSFWDFHPHDVGFTNTCTFAHELDGNNYKHNDL